MESEKNSLRNSLHSNIHFDGKSSPDRYHSKNVADHQNYPEKRSNPSIKSSPRSQTRSPNSEEEEKEYEQRLYGLENVVIKGSSEGNLSQEYERKVENLHRTLKSIEGDVGDVRSYSKLPERERLSLV